MDHKSFLSSLPPDITTQLTRKRNSPGLVHLAAHLSLILLTGTLIARGVPFWPALLPVQGILLTFLFTLQHEATHKTPFANTWLNEWVGHISGLIIGQPFEWFRYFHLAHHRHTNDPDNDPELLAGAKPEGWPQYLLHVSGLLFWSAMARQLLQSATGGAHAPYLPKPALPRIKTEARWMLLTYTFTAISLLASPALFWVWLLPLLLGQPFLRLFLLAEHGRCAFVTNMFENTRTTFTTRTMRFIAWNMPYHVEHHTMPNAPFHRLPQLHALIQAHLQVTADGYVEFSRKFVAGFSGPEEPEK